MLRKVKAMQSELSARERNERFCLPCLVVTDRHPFSPFRRDARRQAKGFCLTLTLSLDTVCNVMAFLRR